MLRQTALIVVFPNFQERKFLHVVGVAERELKLFLFAFAQRDTWAVVTICTTAPLLTQLAKLFNVVGLGRVNLAGPKVCLYNVLKELILFSKALLHALYPAGTMPVLQVLLVFRVLPRLAVVRLPLQLLEERFGTNED